MVVQHNLPAINANRQLGINNSSLSKSLEKLSSGFGINRAADNAAGLAISEKMRGQINGLTQASTNAQDGISLIQTAEGALEETHSILQRMRELAVQSSNGTYQNQVDRENIQKEVDALKSEIDRISTSTHYNNIKLLDGSLKGAETPATEAQNNTEAKIVMDITGVDKQIKTLTVVFADPTGGTSTDIPTAVRDQNKLYELLKGGIDITTTATDVDNDNDVSNDTTLAVFTDEFKTMLENADFDVGTPTTATQKNTYTIKNGAGDTVATIEIDGLAAGGADATTASGNYNVAYDKTATTNTKAFKVDDITVPAKGALTLQIGANGSDDQRVSLSVDDMSSEGIGVADIDVSTRATANASIDVIDEAINKVSGTRADLGALQNRMEHTIKSLNVANENLTAAESRIRDVDMAKEMMTFTKNQILAQASQSMLAQANQLPQGVLQLLQ